MPYITAARIYALCPRATPATVDAIAHELDADAAAFGVTSLLRRAHLMAQLAHESGGFTRMLENLNYSEPRIGQVWPRLAPRAHELAHNPQKLGDAAYAGRFGNGNEHSGDGFRFRGRGLIQLTFKDNYRERGHAIGLDLVSHPDLAAEPHTASKLALSFWQHAGCNALADADDVEGVTRKINGGTNGLAERKELTLKAKGIFL